MAEFMHNCAFGIAVRPIWPTLLILGQLQNQVTEIHRLLISPGNGCHPTDRGPIAAILLAHGEIDAYGGCGNSVSATPGAPLTAFLSEGKLYPNRSIQPFFCGFLYQAANLIIASIKRDGYDFPVGPGQG